MSIHWSRNYLKLIQKILNSIKKDSILLISFPNSNSFYDLKIDQKKFTNKFPKMDELKSFLKDSKYYCSIIKKVHKNEFNNILFFLNSLKKIGANVSNNLSKPKRIIMKTYSKKYLINFITSHSNIYKTVFFDQLTIQLLKNLHFFEKIFLV